MTDNDLSKKILPSKNMKRNYPGNMLIADLLHSPAQ